MIDPQTLIGMIETNSGVIQMQVNGLTHEDSLLQLPFRGNCLNWVLGHLVEHRDKMLKVLGQAPLLNGEQVARYARESQPVTDGEDVMPLAELVGDLQTAKDQIVAALASATPESLAQIVEGSDRSVGQRLHGLLWHETYHVGQTEILRQLAGTNDKVI